MATQSNAQTEPSMEEILASIRRIISEDGDEEAPAPQPALRPRPTAVPPAPALQTPKETPKLIEEDRAEAHLKTEDVEMIKKPSATAARDDAILDETTAAVASKAFQSLTQTVRVSKGEGRTLEDIVTEMLKPMVKEWLDANLAAIVEEKVEDEVQRLARRRG